MCSASVLRHLVQKPRAEAGVAAFYCDGNYPATQDPRNILGSLLKQLILRSPSPDRVIQAVTKLWQSHKHDNDRNFPSKHKIRQVSREFSCALQEIAALFSRVYVVIDGLDECNDKQDIVRELAGISSCEMVNLFISSRVDGTIGKVFAGKPTLRMDENHVQRDIAIHVDWVLEHDTFAIDLDEDLKKEIKEYLLKKSNGM
jgi:hypothetical protein